MKLYLNDLRACPEGWTLARNIREAVRLVADNPIEEMSLDHDLGMVYCRSCAFSDSDEPCFNGLGVKVCDCTCHVEEPSGLDFLKWIHENNKWPDQKPKIHSGNTVGAMNMRNFISDFGPYAK